jgi:hypothetical protein
MAIKADAVLTRAAVAMVIRVDVVLIRVVLVDALEPQPPLYHVAPYDLVVLWSLARR